MEKVPRTDFSPENTYDFQTRTGVDRRKKKSEGYINLGIVGWYCRRERVRRNEDPCTPYSHCDCYPEE